jgi:VWFA-related protein
MTRSQRVALLLAALGIIAATSGVGARQAQAPAASPKFGTATSGVLVDVVVRDKKGPVMDLTQDDFTVIENGQPQQILTFDKRTSQGQATAGDAAVAAGVAKPTGATPGPGPSVVALAFDRLSPEGRALAFKAATQLLADRRADEMIGVFVVDQALHTMQAYTTDNGKLQAGIERAAGTATSLPPAAHTAAAERGLVGPTGPVVASAESVGNPTGSANLMPAGPNPNPGSRDTVSQALGAAAEGVATQEALERMERNYQDLVTETEGRMSVDALLALVDSLGTLPGRKTVVYLCEGMTIPPSVEPRFRSIVDTANRRNVSLYAMDAAGLRVHSEQAATKNQLDDITRATVAGVERSNNGKWTEDLERNETLLKSDPAAALGILTSQTGGLLIQNTNALEKGIQRIDEDRRFHYLLGYTSSNPSMDGSYRHIDVKVKRSGVEVHARQGYVALPADMGAPVLSYEAPALAALAASPKPTAFPMQARALSIPMPGHPGLTAVMIDVATSNLMFAEDAKLGTYSADTIVLAQLDSGTPATSRKQSQQYKLSGKLALLPQAKAGNLLFFRTPELSSGKYALNAVVYDAKGTKASVASSSVTVPAAEKSVVGDLFVVARAEKLPPNDPVAANHPLATAGVLLYPSFGEPISKAKSPELTFALPIVAPGETPTATLQILQGGQKLAEIPLPLDKPGADGRLLQTARLPSAAIPPGTYDFKAVVAVGGGKVERSTTVTLTP